MKGVVDITLTLLCLSSHSPYAVLPFSLFCISNQFRTVLGQLQPREVVYPLNSLSIMTLHVLRTDLTTDVLKNELALGSEFWNDSMTIREITKAKYFDMNVCEEESKSNMHDGEYAHWPTTIVEHIHAHANLAVSALGGIVFYLRRMMHDTKLLSMKLFAAYEQVQGGAAADILVLDGQTLANLEVLRNQEGGTEGTLFKYIDHCTSAFGRRMLRDWLVRPLATATKINERIDAVEYLMNNVEAIKSIQRILSSLPDIERLLARVHANGLKQHITPIMYYNVDKVKLEVFLKVLKAFDKAMEISKVLEGKDLTDIAMRLKKLITPV